MTRRSGHEGGGPSSEQVRASMWFWPLLASAGSFLLTLALLLVRPAADTAFAERVFPGDSSTATSLLQTVATAGITAASLTFSLTVVALQLASQQFSPRLLRSFARDSLAQATMALLSSTVVVSLTTLRGLDPERPLPVLALLLSLVLGVLAAPVLVLFVAHIARRLRVDTMMASVHSDTKSNIEASYAPRGEGPEHPDASVPRPEDGMPVPALRSGFVRTVDPDGVAQTARRHGVVVLLGVRPGDVVGEGTPVGTVVPRERQDVDVDALARELATSVVLGVERTEEQDVAFGLRQLVDIAVKAVSPAVNDPTTAAEALSFCGDLLQSLQKRRLGSQVVRDADGVLRALLPDRDLAFYLDLVCAQLRRYGRGDPAVLNALLRVLRDLATTAQDHAERDSVRVQVDLVLDEVPEELLEHDRQSVQEMARRVRLALDGDVVGAYRDRAGETRTI